MAFMTFLASTWLALAALAVGDIDYPATIEIDLLFPRNETYNSNITGIPVVLAVQNAEAAYAYEWSIAWRISSAAASSSDTHYIRGTSKSQMDENEFQYLFGNTAVIPMTQTFAAFLNAGKFLLEWDYATTPCIPEGETSVWQTRTPIVSGTHYFSIVEDGSGLDFGIPLDECPTYGDSWTLDDSDACPMRGDGNDREGNPCAAQLVTREQVDCIWEYISTRENETETCLSAFERADPDWSMYYTPGLPDDGPTEDDILEDDNSSSSADPEIPTMDDVGEDIGVSLRAGMHVLVAILAFVVAL